MTRFSTDGNRTQSEAGQGGVERTRKSTITLLLEGWDHTADKAVRGIKGRGEAHVRFAGAEIDTR